MNGALETGRIGRDLLYRRLVAAITIAGAVLRIVVLVSKWGVPTGLNDSIWYSAQGHILAHSGFFPTFFRVSGAEHPPLAAIVAAPASLLPEYVFFQRATMTLIGISFIPLIALVARRVGGRRAGVLAAAIAALYPNIWLSDALVMSESVALVLIAVVLLAALRFRERFDLASAVLLGVLIGVAGHARSEVLIVAPVYAFIGVRSHPWRLWVSRAGVLLAGTAVVVTPWVGWNLSRFDKPVLMSTNEGTTLLGANCSATYAGPGLGGWAYSCVDEPVDRPGEDPSERSARRRREAVSFARDHAGQLPKVITARVLRALDLYGLDNLVDNDQGEERPRWAVWAGVVSWWLLAPMAAVGVWRSRRQTGLVLFAPVICVLVTSILFYGSHRLRAPVEPVIVVGAALFLAAWPALDARFARFTTRWRDDREAAVALPV